MSSEDFTTLELPLPYEVLYREVTECANGLIVAVDPPGPNPRGEITVYLYYEEVDYHSRHYGAVNDLGLLTRALNRRPREKGSLRKGVLRRVRLRDGMDWVDLEYSTRDGYPFAQVKLTKVAPAHTIVRIFPEMPAPDYLPWLRKDSVGKRADKLWRVKTQIAARCFDDKLLEYLRELCAHLLDNDLIWRANNAQPPEILYRLAGRPQPKGGKTKPGRAANPDDEWARRQVRELGRRPGDVYPEWLERIGPRAEALIDPRDSFNKAIRPKKAKTEKRE